MAFQMAGGVGLSGPSCGGEPVDVTTPWVSIIGEGVVGVLGFRHKTGLFAISGDYGKEGATSQTK